MARGSKIILVLNGERAEQLMDMGYSCQGERDVNGQVCYQFFCTDKLRKLLNDKSFITRREWVEDSKLTF
jgi:hypothetical protein